MEPLENDTIHYDLSYLRELDDEQYLQEIISLFLDSTPHLLNEIGEAVDADDWQDIHQKAHKLKSSLGLLKMDPLLKYINEIEFRAKGQTDMDKIKEMLKLAKSEYEIASGLLEKEIV